MNNELIKDYLSTLKCSRLTKDSYRYDLKVFCDYLLSNGKEIKELEIIDVEDFFENCIKEGRSVNTILRYKVSLNRFFKHLVSIGLVKRNVVEGAYVNASKIINTSFFDNGNCEKVYNHIKATDSLRDKIIFKLIYEYGVNTSEISKLLLNDFDKNELWLKGRTIFLDEELVRDLNKYLDERKNYLYGTESKKLFISKCRKSISRVSIYKNITRKAKELDINISPRLLRKIAVLKMLQKESVEKVAHKIGIQIEQALAYKEMI